MKNKLLKELKILLVEDEQKLASLLKDAIGDSFYSFTIAHDGKEGIDLFLKLLPDIVITDIMMPNMTGLEMAKKLKDINSELPIIILSAFSDTNKLLNAIDVGIVKYFIKPFDPDELLDYIKNIVNKFESKLIELDDNFLFNQTTKSLYKNGRYVILSKREREFFHLLLKYYKKHEDYKEMIDNQLIKQELWTEESVSNERVRTFVKRLRQKTSKKLIQNIRGQGYKIISKIDDTKKI